MNIDFLNDNDIIFGVAQGNLSWTFLNHFTIISKQVICYNRLKNFLLLLCEVIINIKYIGSIERSVALKNNKLKTHDEQWKPIINFL